MNKHEQELIAVAGSNLRKHFLENMVGFFFLPFL